MVLNRFQPGDPYCTQCGYLLRGHEAAPRCPECAAPLPAALGRFDEKEARRAVHGYHSRSSATLFGWPLVSIALGPDPERGGEGGRRGMARGIIAIGDGAIGGVAIGGGAVGIVAVGGGAVGVVGIGGGAAGLLAALGGGAAGGFATGGLAAGGVATGGLAVGYVAQGGLAVGVYARGGSATGAHTITSGAADPAAQRVFETLQPVLGASPPTGLPAGAALGRSLAPPLAAAGLLAAIIGAAVVLAQRRHEGGRRRRSAAIDQIVREIDADNADLGPAPWDGEERGTLRGRRDDGGPNPGQGRRPSR